MQSLAVKYRPTEFEDVVSQKSIIKILTRQLDLKEYSNVYLFAGPSGCGKTTLARIFANKINNNQGSPIEIDAASNNGVDNVREIIKSAKERSLDSEYKIYIIDECVDGDTEILTSEGFVKIKNLKKGIPVAQYTDAGNIEFVTPIEYIEKEYSGDMYSVSLRHGKNTLLMSPHHVQPLRFKISNTIKEAYIKDVKFAQSNELITAGKGTGNLTVFSELDCLAIAAQADGHLLKFLPRRNLNLWEFGLKYSNKIDRLKYLLDKCNIHYKEYIGKKSTKIVCRLPVNITKDFTTYFNLSSMGFNYADSFISEILFWDGSKKSGYPGFYSSTAEINVDFVSAVLCLCGKQGVKSSYDYKNIKYKRNYTIHWFNRDSAPSTACDKQLVSNFNGKIYCVKVPSKKIVLRADGFVFISGNCHMLTIQSWNALLKLIEEPPVYTIFMFATTDPQKIPDTIKNRVMRFNLSRISSENIKDRLIYICNKENFINYEDACDYISRISNNQMRDAIASLEKCARYSNDLSIDNITKALGTYSYNLFVNLLDNILDGNSNEVISIINTIYNDGSDMKLFVDQFLSFSLDVCKYCICNDMLVTKLPTSLEENIKKITNFDNPSRYYTYIIDNLLTLKNMLKTDINPKDTIEIFFIKLCGGN